MLKKVLSFFLSLRTAIGLLFALIFFLFFGSFVMPLREEFQALHAVPLFQWLAESPFSITWWLWVSLAILSLLTVNTLLCSLESVIKKRGARQWLLILSPQVIHAGFLFILLAHLLSSYGSFKGTTAVYKGSMLPLPNGLTVLFDEIRADVDQSGYVLNWAADIRYFKDGVQISGDSVLPNAPSFMNGFGIYIKTVRFEPYPSAIIEVSREPGAPWALAGGILFLAGMTTLLILKIRREEILEKDSGGRVKEEINGPNSTS